MDKWKWDLTVEEILNFEPEPEPELEAESKDEAASDADGEAEAAPPVQPISPPVEEAEETLQESPILKPGERSPFL